MSIKVTSIIGYLLVWKNWLKDRGRLKWWDSICLFDWNKEKADNQRERKSPKANLRSVIGERISNSEINLE